MTGKTIIVGMFVCLFAFAAAAYEIEYYDQQFMDKTGIAFPDGIKIQVNAPITAKVADPAKLTKMGLEGVIKDMAVTVTYKSEKMVEVVFPDLKKKMFLGWIGGEWELQAIMSS